MPEALRLAAMTDIDSVDIYTKKFETEPSTTCKPLHLQAGSWLTTNAMQASMTGQPELHAALLQEADALSLEAERLAEVMCDTCRSSLNTGPEASPQPACRSTLNLPMQVVDALVPVAPAVCPRR
jgi:hypothetical protein